MTDYDTDKQGEGDLSPLLIKPCDKVVKLKNNEVNWGQVFPFLLFCDFQSGNFGDREDLKLDMF